MFSYLQEMMTKREGEEKAALMGHIEEQKRRLIDIEHREEVSAKRFKTESEERARDAAVLKEYIVYSNDLLMRAMVNYHYIIYIISSYIGNIQYVVMIILY